MNIEFYIRMLKLLYIPAVLDLVACIGIVLSHDKANREFLCRVVKVSTLGMMMGIVILMVLFIERGF